MYALWGSRRQAACGRSSRGTHVCGAHRVLRLAQLRSRAERDVARRRARERERPAGGAKRARHRHMLLLLSVYGKAADERAPCGVSSPHYVFLNTTCPAVLWPGTWDAQL